jgi:hypothetical protein
MYFRRNLAKITLKTRPKRAVVGPPPTRKRELGSKTVLYEPGGFPPGIPAADHPQSNQREAVMAETWSGEFYCVKCKEKREATGEIRVNDKGTKMAGAVCPVCGTKLNRILGKA